MEYNEAVQSLCFCPAVCLSIPDRRQKRQKRFHDLFPDLITLCDLFLIHRPGSSRPVLFPGTDSSFPGSDHIVFQQIQLFLPDMAKPCAQIPEHAFIAEVLRCHLQSRPDKFDKRIHENRFCLINKVRDPVFLKDAPHIISIRCQISGDDRNILIAVFLFPDQLQDLSGCIVHLLGCIFCCMNGYGILLFFVDCPVMAQQMTLQKSQCRRIPKSRTCLLTQKYRVQDFDSGFLCQLPDAVDCLLTQVEELVHIALLPWIFLCIQRNGYGDAARKLHQLPEKLLLHRSKSGKSIQQNSASLQEL